MKIEKIEAYRIPNGSLYPSEAEARKAMVRFEIYDLCKKSVDDESGGYGPLAAASLVSFFESYHEEIYEIMKAASEKGTNA